MLPRSYANAVQGNGTVGSVSTPAGTSQFVPQDEHIDTDVDTSFQYNMNVIDNNSHPLYLHNNDHPGLILIAKKLTGPENYAPWSRSMQIALSARNKFVIVNGVFEKPEAKSVLYPQWERVNDMIITWILNSVADDSLNFVTSASEVWTELLERFSGINGHRIYQVMKDIHSIEQGNKSVEVYFHKLKGLWDEFAVLEPSVLSVHVVLIRFKPKEIKTGSTLLQFLMGLHDSNIYISQG